jgi:MFS family permease
MTDRRVAPRAWAMLAVLGLLYILSFIDRFILALLVKPLRADLGLTDVQLGLLFGTFFALFYGVLGLPIARSADRGNRKRLIIAGVVIWSACTTASAFAQDYTTLAVLRFGLATGEAALTPAAFSLLTDAFPPHRRMLAGTLFSASGMAGASLSFAIGAGVIGLADGWASGAGIASWRLTFIAVGLPGFLLAALFAVIAREPVRIGEAAAVSFGAVLRHLGAHARLYGGLFGGAAAAQMLSYAVVAWSPALLQRSFGLDVKEAGLMLGVANVFSAVGGTLIVPTVLRHLAARNPRAAGAVPFTAVVAGIALVLVALHLPSVIGFLVVNALGGFLINGAVNAIIVLVQPIAPPAMRATFTALLLICISSIGLGVGPPVAAAIGERAGLAGGLSALGVIAVVLAGSAFAAAIRPLGLALTDLGERTQ